MWLETFEMSLAAIVGVLKLALESVSVLCVASGLIVTASVVIAQLGRRERAISFATVRLRLGTWLALALEFQLAADIVATTVAPSPEALGKLAAIAVIRTFLNYFLQKELEAEKRTAGT